MTARPFRIVGLSALTLATLTSGAAGILTSDPPLISMPGIILRSDLVVVGALHSKQAKGVRLTGYDQRGRETHTVFLRRAVLHVEEILNGSERRDRIFVYWQEPEGIETTSVGSNRKFHNGDRGIWFLRKDQSIGYRFDFLDVSHLADVRDVLERMRAKGLLRGQEHSRGLLDLIDELWREFLERNKVPKE